MAVDKKALKKKIKELKKLEKQRKKEEKKKLKKEKTSKAKDEALLKELEALEGTSAPNKDEAQIEPKRAEGGEYVWVKRSKLNIEDIERKIDAMDLTTVGVRRERTYESLIERYAQKYGEPLELPEDIVLTKEESKDLELIDLSGERGEEKEDGIEVLKAPAKKPSPKTEASEGDLSFWDLRRGAFLYLKNKTGKALLAVVDILLNIPLIIPRVIVTAVLAAKGKKANGDAQTA